MGVTRWLVRVDPARWEEAVAGIKAQSSAAEARRYLARFKKKATDELLERFEEADEQSGLADARNMLLELAVTEERWYLDKALSRFESIPKYLPNLIPLRKVFDFAGIDVQVPEGCGPEENGLYGCLSAKQQAGCIQALEPFQSFAAVLSALRAVKPTMLERLRGRAAAAANFATELEQRDYAESWSDLCTAVVTTHRHGHFLGLGMAS